VASKSKLLSSHECGSTKSPPKVLSVYRFSQLLVGKQYFTLLDVFENVCFLSPQVDGMVCFVPHEPKTLYSLGSFKRKLTPATLYYHKTWRLVSLHMWWMTHILHCLCFCEHNITTCVCVCVCVAGAHIIGAIYTCEIAVSVRSNEMKGIRGLYNLIWNHKLMIFEAHCRPSLEDCEKNTDT